MRSLVLGSTGFLGAHLVRALVANGSPPTCGRRARAHALTLRGLDVSLVPADLDEPAQLRAAMADHDVVFHLAGHYPRYSFHPEIACATGLTQLDNVLRAAREAGVRRVVYVSSTATVAPASGRASTEDDVFDGPPGFGTYHDLKWRMEDRAAAERDLDVVIACPAACIGPWDVRVGTSAMLVALARGYDPPHPDGTIAIVDPADVARALVALAEHPNPPRRLLLAAGNHGVHDLLSQLAVRYGVPLPQPALPAGVARALADSSEREAARRTGRATLSREIVDLIVHGVPVDARRALPLIGGAYTPFHVTLDRFDAWARRVRLIPQQALEFA